MLDRAGVLAQMASILGNLQISIASVIQKEVGLNDGTAELVITTYHSRERDVQQALRELAGLGRGEGNRKPPEGGGVAPDTGRYRL